VTSLTATTSAEVGKALTAERRAAGAVTQGLVLTFVVVTSESYVGENLADARAASMAHPCRVIAVVPGDPEGATRLDAEVSVGGASGPGQAIVLRLSGALVEHADSVVLPLLATDTPVVTWWAGPPPEYPAGEPLGVLASRRVTDTYRAEDPRESLRLRARQYQPGDTDLTWTRDTLWRSIIAAVVDALPGPVTAVTVVTERGNPSAALLAAWLSIRLGVDVQLEDGPGPAITALRLTARDDDPAAPAGAGGQPEVEVELTRPDGHTATLTRTGQPDRVLPLPIRGMAELLAEELRRLGPDEPYADALAAVERIPAGSPV